MQALPDGIRQRQPHSERLPTLGDPALRRGGALGGLRSEGQKALGERGMTKLKSNESCRCWRRLRGVYQLEKEVGPVGTDRQVADLAHDKHGRLLRVARRSLSFPSRSDSTSESTKSDRVP